MGMYKTDATRLYSLGVFELGGACASLLVRFRASKGLSEHPQAQAFGGSRASRAAAEGEQKLALRTLQLTSDSLEIIWL